jgi:hypothetical protein
METYGNPITLIKIIIQDPTYVDMKLFVNTNEFILYNSKLGIYDIYSKQVFITGHLRHTHII